MPSRAPFLHGCDSHAYVVIAVTAVMPKNPVYTHYYTLLHITTHITIIKPVTGLVIVMNQVFYSFYWCWIFLKTDYLLSIIITLSLNHYYVLLHYYHYIFFFLILRCFTSLLHIITNLSVRVGERHGGRWGITWGLRLLVMKNLGGTGMNCLAQPCEGKTCYQPTYLPGEAKSVK